MCRRTSALKRLAASSSASRCRKHFTCYGSASLLVPHLSVVSSLKLAEQVFFLTQNPEVKNPPNAGLGKNQKADYPEEKKEEFEGTPGGYSWISAKDTSLLDFEGCEMVLIGNRSDISGAPFWIVSFSSCPLLMQTLCNLTHGQRYLLQTL